MFYGNLVIGDNVYMYVRTRLCRRITYLFIWNIVIIGVVEVLVRLCILSLVT